MEWVTDGEKNGIVAFTRTLGTRKVLVAANLIAKEVDGGPLVGKLAPTLTSSNRYKILPEVCRRALRFAENFVTIFSA